MSLKNGFHLPDPMSASHEVVQKYYGGRRKLYSDTWPGIARGGRKLYSDIGPYYLEKEESFTVTLANNN